MPKKDERTRTNARAVMEKRRFDGSPAPRLASRERYRQLNEHMRRTMTEGVPSMDDLKKMFADQATERRGRAEDFVVDRYVHRILKKINSSR